VGLKLKVVVILLRGGEPIKGIEYDQSSCLISECKHPARGIKLQRGDIILLYILLTPGLIAEELGAVIGLDVLIIYAHITSENDHNFRRNVF
jgi:hypothetical protein